MNKLPRTLRRRAIAYLLVPLFPTGAHRFYLGQPLGGALFLGLTGGALLALNAGRHDAAWTLFGIELGVALFDLMRTAPRLTALDQALRPQAHPHPASDAPQAIPGRDTDEPDLPRAGRGDKNRDES
jgi:hypothetical protein